MPRRAGFIIRGWQNRQVSSFPTPIGQLANRAAGPGLRLGTAQHICKPNTLIGALGQIYAKVAESAGTLGLARDDRARLEPVPFL
jgi:hypothetical protein